MSGTNCGNGADSHLLALYCCPLGLDLDDPFFAVEIMSETAPGPVLRFLHQSAFYGVAVYVAQLFDALALAPDIEVVVPALPEMCVRKADHASDSLLERLDQG